MILYIADQSGKIMMSIALYTGGGRDQGWFDRLA